MAPKAIFSHRGHVLSSNCEPPRCVQDNLGFKGGKAQVY